MANIVPPKNSIIQSPSRISLPISIPIFKFVFLIIFRIYRRDKERGNALYAVNKEGKEKEKAFFLSLLSPLNHIFIGLSFCVFAFLLAENTEKISSSLFKGQLTCSNSTTHMFKLNNSKSIPKEPNFKQMYCDFLIITSEINFFLCFG